MPTEDEIRDGRLQALQSRDDEIARLRKALEFYARPLAYDGPNQRNVGQDEEHTPKNAPYIVDVTRDGGLTACKALGIVPDKGN